GLVGVGGHVPRYRLSGKALAQVWGGGASGERAVANYDEDALTMATEAALDAMAGRESSRVGACFFASTSAPYVEKSNATLLATVVDLPIAVLTADITGSLRSGTTALRLALDAVAAGSVREALVAAGDMRPVAPGGELEPLLGDGAGAAVVGGGAGRAAASRPDPRRLLRQRRRGSALRGDRRSRIVLCESASQPAARGRPTARVVRQAAALPAPRGDRGDPSVLERADGGARG